MIRLIGILTGSAIAIAFLIVMLGIPQFAAPPPAVVATPEALPEASAYEPMAPASEPLATASEPLEPVSEAVAPVSEAVEPVAEPVAAVSEPLATVSESVAAIEELQEQVEQRWYAFWSPFRSKIAADGFVSQLQRTTGLDYRVVKLKPGVYEVAFAYGDDSDIEQKLTQISSATGLDLSGG